MDNSNKQSVLTTGDWILTFLITFIPIVGFIMLFVWAFGSQTNENKANWAKAALIWLVIVVVVYVVLFAAIGAAFLSALE